MKKLWIVLSILASSSFATVPATTVWELRATATAGNLNGCGFDSSNPGVGTDYSLQDTFQSSGTVLSTSDGLAASSFTVTASGYDFSSLAWVRNSIHITAGTSWTSTGAGSWHIIIATGPASTQLVVTGPGGSANSLSNGTFYIGGACSLNSTIDNDLFQNFVAGNLVWIKNGSYTFGEALSALTAGGTASPVQIAGYNSTRGDNPTGTNRPSLTSGASAVTFPSDWNFFNVSFTGSATPMMTVANNKFTNVKFLNNSTTAARSAISLSAGLVGTFSNCEIMSYRGNGITYAGGTAVARLYGCYLHDSNTAITSIATAGQLISLNSLYVNNISSAIVFTGLHSVGDTFIGNTFVGSSASGFAGNGIAYVTGASRYGSFLNNSFYLLNVPINIADAQTYTDSQNNNFFSNTKASVNFSTSTTDTFVDPQFRNVVLRSGSTATTTAGNHFVQAGATFQTWGITAGVDYIWVSGGTSVTAGIYGIASVDSETQITTDVTLTANATADKTWAIIQYRDFTAGANLRNRAYPSTITGSQSINYLDVGAVQHRDAPRAIAF